MFMRIECCSVPNLLRLSKRQRLESADEVRAVTTEMREQTLRAAHNFADVPDGFSVASRKIATPPAHLVPRPAGPGHTVPMVEGSLCSFFVEEATD